jgi:ribosome maturation factor RimP
MGFELVGIEIAGGSGAKILRFTADRLPGPLEDAPAGADGDALSPDSTLASRTAAGGALPPDASVVSEAAAVGSLPPDASVASEAAAVGSLPPDTAVASEAVAGGAVPAGSEDSSPALAGAFPSSLTGVPGNAPPSGTGMSPDGAADGASGSAPGAAPGVTLAGTRGTAPEAARAGVPWRGSGITLDDCAVLSRALSAMLDDLWPGDGPGYVLEVSSPGLDRPLLSEADLVRFSGSLARLRLRRDGRTEVVSGRLDCSPGSLSVTPREPPPRPGRPAREALPVAFEWADVSRARLLPEI